MILRKVSLFAFLSLFLIALIAACGTEPPAGDCLEPGEDGMLVSVPCEAGGTPVATPTPTPDDPGNGNGGGLTVFQGSGCGNCHTIDGVSTGAVGPALTTIGSVAAGRVSGQSAEDYIHESIINPSAFVVDGYPDGVMPPNYQTLLSVEEIDSLVAYLASLQ